MTNRINLNWTINRNSSTVCKNYCNNMCSWKWDK